jgi:hypothetical protein
MKFPKFSLLLTLMLIVGLVPFTASAASASVSLNAVTSIHPGDSVTISGTSSLSEVIVKVVRPSNSVVFFDIVKVNAADGKFSTSFTLGGSEAAGTYKIVVGQGNDVGTQDLVVVSNGDTGADLSGLTLSHGALDPAFAPGTIAYSTSVANNVSSVTVKASVSDVNATLTVNGVPVASGQSSGAIGLIVGGNVILIEVTAQNGTKKTYSVSVTRVAGGGGGGGGGPSIVTSTNGILTLPAGGTGVVSLEDKVTVSIPANATSKELKLTIEKLLATQNLLTNKEVLLSSIFEILKNFPENFSKPVTLTFVFDPASLKNNQRASVFYYDETKKIWVEVGGKVNGNKISVEVDHFTKYAVLAVGQGDTPTAVSFSDISGHWAEANIKQAVNDGIVKGYSDGTFKPGKTVTRAEFAVMLMNALKPQEAGAALTFTDATKIGAWAQKAVAQAVQAEIIKGYKDGTFRPNAEITRAEMAAMIANALKLTIESDSVTGFSDDKAIPAWAKGSIAHMKQAGIMQGKGDNEFAPLDQASRAEAVTVLLNMLAQKNK